MKYTKAQLRQIYRKTNGRCHLTGKRIVFKHYGLAGNRGAWEVDHSRPRSFGGADHGNNLYPSCLIANRSKGNQSTVSFRRRHGLSKAPLSHAKIAKIKEERAVAGFVSGALIGLRVGPLGALIGGVIGAIVGDSMGVE